ncbi:hypothetical protein K461DRAFT_277501 [Myriangium duriaei CBS 260.36]|uniref:Uncharacterized protein n=1 Tax=Myriangium duriaei CBS 260.36 TaxID=1168546 RepID=A0A9P4J3E2_9PEZI|nr:hypothetical protein K461DRAFT_277501 [Myriangium duriaei CBS 260.36]
MAAFSDPPSVFKHFQSLATELRLQVWRESLPLDPGPALFLWRKECRSHRILLEPSPWEDDLISRRFDTCRGL